MTVVSRRCPQADEAPREAARHARVLTFVRRHVYERSRFVRHESRRAESGCKYEAAREKSAAFRSERATDVRRCLINL